MDGQERQELDRRRTDLARVQDAALGQEQDRLFDKFGIKKLSNEIKALQTLGLDERATPDAVKTQYKTLVKRLHPDANGGSRANEDTLKAVIQAYDHLRSSGFC